MKQKKKDAAVQELYKAVYSARERVSKMSTEQRDLLLKKAKESMRNKS